MAPIRVKICGITRVDDAIAAAEAGVDAIGMVFYPDSPRAVSSGQAADIVASLPPFVTAVGLFVNAEAAAINAVLDSVPLDVLQFHGDESAEFCASFRRPYLKAVRMREGVDLVAEAKRYQGARALLLDAWSEHAPGGTGKTFDWNLIARDISLPFALAGGLDADNVAAALAKVRPAAIDLSSGVEREPGVKDAAKIGEFMAVLRAAAV
ncbi:MAG: phosphoribosylanthranilate isomerase [Halioglobus sp.]